MITIEIKKDKGFFKQINIKGHANYDVKGKDIVCSSVSSIVTTTINGILSFDKTIEYLSKEEQFQIIILNNDKITNTLILNMINLFKELASDYPKNIKILEEE